MSIDNEAVIPDDVLRFAEKGLSIGKKIDCFDFVPSDPGHVWRMFSSLPVGHICEWGSGIGVATGIARMLGHQATGIELNQELAASSRILLQEFDLDCRIYHGSYFDLEINADYYFVYCWPGKMNQVQDHFAASTPANAKLLICHGAEDIRCKVKVKPQGS